MRLPDWILAPTGSKDTSALSFSPSSIHVRYASQHGRLTMKQLIVALVLCSALHLALAALAPNSTLVPDNIFYLQTGPDQLAVVAPGIEFQGRLLRNTSAASVSECSAACLNDSTCDLFGFTECSEVEVRGSC